MDIGELHHLLFRWLHVVSAVMWIGHIWSLVFAQHMYPRKSDAWMRGWAGVTALTGVALLIFVYYAGGALTTPSQSLWMAVGVGVAVLFLTWLLYDAVWTLFAQRPAVATVVSLLLVGGIAQGLAEFMTGRAVFIHVGATLGIILLNNTNQRPLRIADNAVIAPAVLLFMVSNHFPLIYGSSRPWLVAPTLVAWDARRDSRFDGCRCAAAGSQRRKEHIANCSSSTQSRGAPHRLRAYGASREDRRREIQEHTSHPTALVFRVVCLLAAWAACGPRSRCSSSAEALTQLAEKCKHLHFSASQRLCVETAKSLAQACSASLITRRHARRS